MASKVVAVFGATGAQGGSVVRALLQNNANKAWRVVALTRDVNSEKAKQLKASVAEVVAFDLLDPSSMVEYHTTSSTVDDIFLLIFFCLQIK